MTFIWPWMLLSLLLAPCGVVVYFWLLRRRQRMAADLGPLGLVQNRDGGPGRRRHTPPLLFLCGLSLLLVSLARPQSFVRLPRMGGTVILAFDVSSSMAADDLEPTRLEAAKVAAKAFVEQQPSTIQIGVVAFGNGGLVVQPPGNDTASILAAIDRLTAQGGTSLGQGIFSSLSAIAGEALAIDPEALDPQGAPVEIGHFPSAVILLLTDGENTRTPDPEIVAQLAADAGVRIYPVGVGSTEGAVLEIDGYNVQTYLDEALLQAIASTTNGTYQQADSAESLRQVYETVDLQLTIDGEVMEVTGLVAGFGLLFLLIGGVLSLFWFGRVP